MEAYGICPECKELNGKMCSEKADLTGYTAVVTGGRINIGYAVCLRLLRCGARVMAVTRFPYDALDRYSKEPDYSDFCSRLTICGFDLKRADRMDELIGFIKETYPEGLDILVNNAAQTIRKAPSYYAALSANEDKLRLCCDSTAPAVAEIAEELPALFNMPADVAAYETPDHNSWVSKADEISAAELLEVQLINVTAPFLLIGQLKAHMKKSTHKNRFVINVSSVEGRFNHSKKLSRHVHTNMAKASLNMLTHSLADEYAREGIFIYSVDPGWVSNQFPSNYEVSKSFVPYLSFEDGASRITHPIYMHLNDEKAPDDVGALYKNFVIVPY